MSKFFSDNLSLSVPSGPYWVISYTCVTKYMSSNLGSLSKVTTPMAFYALTNIVKNAAAGVFIQGRQREKRSVYGHLRRS